ncbi:pectate lyase [Microbulbifer hainanensis]|uniref:pectate lyase n=1 Tax=Microbulbifer hainanensis TaxID=2735675 RepID=UPI0018675719|nr:pectate lyase [Microbulbifer hainanensis]
MKTCRLLLAAVLAMAAASCSADRLTDAQPAHNMADYRALSQQLQQLDRDSMAGELAQLQRQKPLPAVYAKRFGFGPDKGTDYYRTPEGQKIADIVLSYQTPSGGWSKRTEMGKAPRAPGQAFGVEKNYIPTFDNGATSTQFWVMVRAYGATGDERYAAAAERALRLILLAQYPHGGWPQSFPLRGKYHDLITFNDGAICDLLEIVRAAARDEPELQFLPGELRALAADSLQRGLQMLVESQVVIDGRTTIWGAQHDPQTLAPAAARAFEPASLASKESAELVLFLMKLEQPSDAVKRAIVSAHDWFERHRISGYRWALANHDFRELIPDRDADPLWARFYDLSSDRPVFGDRDGRVYYDIRELSRERNLGYGWYTEHPNKVIKRYPAWAERHLQGAGG